MAQKRKRTTKIRYPFFEFGCSFREGHLLHLGCWKFWTSLRHVLWFQPGHFFLRGSVGEQQRTPWKVTKGWSCRISRSPLPFGTLFISSRKLLTHLPSAGHDFEIASSNRIFWSRFHLQPMSRDPRVVQSSVVLLAPSLRLQQNWEEEDIHCSGGLGCPSKTCHYPSVSAQCTIQQTRGIKHMVKRIFILLKCPVASLLAAHLRNTLRYHSFLLASDETHGISTWRASSGSSKCRSVSPQARLSCGDEAGALAQSFLMRLLRRMSPRPPLPVCADVSVCSSKAPCACQRLSMRKSDPGRFHTPCLWEDLMRSQLAIRVPQAPLESCPPPPRWM